MLIAKLKKFSELALRKVLEKTQKQDAKKILNVIKLLFIEFQKHGIKHYVDEWAKKVEEARKKIEKERGPIDQLAIQMEADSSKGLPAGVKIGVGEIPALSAMSKESVIFGSNNSTKKKVKDAKNKKNASGSRKSTNPLKKAPSLLKKRSSSKKSKKDRMSMANRIKPLPKTIETFLSQLSDAGLSLLTYQFTYYQINHLINSVSMVLKPLELDGSEFLSTQTFNTKLKRTAFRLYLEQPTQYDFVVRDPKSGRRQSFLGKLWFLFTKLPVYLARQSSQQLSKQNQELDFLMEKLTSLVEPIQESNWQDAVETWVSMFALLDKKDITAERGKLVLHCMFCDEGVESVLAQSRALIAVNRGRVIPELLMKMKEALGGHIKVEILLFIL